MKTPQVIKNYTYNLQFIPLKPRLLARIIKNYYKLIILQEPRLRVVNLAVNYACQLACRHCSAEELRKKENSGEKLSLSQLEKVFREAEKCGAVNFHFTGGEPLLDKDFYKIATLADPDRNILSVVTNGLLLAGESENLKKAGFSLVIVSIDSPNPDIHDEIRQYKGCHKKAWEGIEAAHKAGIKVMVAMVATRENLRSGEVEEQVRLCREKNITLQILPARGVGMWKDEKKLLLDSEDQLRFHQLVNRRGVRWDGQSSYFTPQCLAGRERVYINPDGDVFPCDFIHIPFGSVKEEPLGDIWQRMLNTPPYNHKNPVCLSAFDKDFINLMPETKSKV